MERKEILNERSANLEFQERVLLYFLFVLFFLFICKAKRKKSTKRKRKHAVFLRPSGVQTKWMFSAIAIAIAESL